ncbi:hypothetical protein LTR37_002025 [Vermiconidia calcicola]|uniref:Uncharacterized protein n=1 Tax=Vermiconidia calcicola TaxID=1690605 RepID=A0ACC3NTM3_9PEZI|nr:hypothetical protein LTR37_002025 [Vermiconidia calcicola]
MAGKPEEASRSRHPSGAIGRFTWPEVNSDAWPCVQQDQVTVQDGRKSCKQHARNVTSGGGELASGGRSGGE